MRHARLAPRPLTAVLAHKGAPERTEVDGLNHGAPTPEQEVAGARGATVVMEGDLGGRARHRVAVRGSRADDDVGPQLEAGSIIEKYDTERWSGGQGWVLV